MRIRKRLFAFFAFLLPGCAAIESWDGFSGGARPLPPDGGQPEASPIDADTDAGPKNSIELVQFAATAIDDNKVKVVTVPLTKAERAGDLLVVVVGWFDTTSSVTTVADTRGNTYKRAIGPTLIGNQNPVAQSIYFAVPIVAADQNGNTVTVTFDAMAASPDIRVVEYAGIDPKDPLDAMVAGSGRSTAASSGPATTHFAHELVFAGATTQGDFSATTPGPDLTPLFATSEDNLVMNLEVHEARSYTASAPQPESAEWVVQLVTFRGAI